MDVTVTGTGCPIPDGHRAGPGVLVRTPDVQLQFDAGRGTLMRLASCGVAPTDLDVVFLTHHHSDHTMGISDLAHSRWLQSQDERSFSLPVCVPTGPCEDFLSHALAPFEGDVEVRRAHTSRGTRPGFDVTTFHAESEPVEVWRHDDVIVTAVSVNHGPVRPAVAYRVDSPDGAVVISGDTAPCEEIVALSRGADLLIHEVMRKSVVQQWDKKVIAEYHTGCRELGELVTRAAVPNVLVTHLIPPPKTVTEAAEFAREIRAGGFAGRLVVADDLVTFHVATSEVSSQPVVGPSRMTVDAPL